MAVQLVKYTHNPFTIPKSIQQFIQNILYCSQQTTKATYALNFHNTAHVPGMCEILQTHVIFLETLFNKRKKGKKKII